MLILSLCVFGFSTSRSALYSMAVLIICCCFDKDDRFSLKKLVNALRSGAIGSTTVITATAICGIIISMLTMTGLGVKFSSLLISLGSSSLLISLLLAMLVCIVLGMGLPTAAAYIIASSTIATALIKLGVPVLGAHMFLFYFSSIACITPPVALASYAAAGICKAPPMKVSMEAVKIGHRGLPGALCLYLQSIHPHLRFQQSLHDSGYHRHLLSARRGCSPHLLCGTGVPLPAHPPV